MKNFLLTILLLAQTLVTAGASQTPNIDEIKERGVLRVGLSTFVPWAMRDKQGQLIGFEVDVARRLAQDNDLKIEFIPTAWDGIIPALLANKFDVVIGGLSVTPQRAKSILFTIPYSHSGVQLAANVNLAKNFKTFADFNSRKIKIAVKRGAFTVQVAREYFPKARLLQFDDENQVFFEVLNGNAHAAIASSPKPEYKTLEYPKLLFLPFKERLSQGNEAFAVRLGETDKKAFFDTWINARTQDGWLKERYEYWFTTVNWQDQVISK